MKKIEDMIIFDDEKGFLWVFILLAFLLVVPVSDNMFYWIILPFFLIVLFVMFISTLKRPLNQMFGTRQFMKRIKDYDFVLNLKTGKKILKSGKDYNIIKGGKK